MRATATATAVVTNEAGRSMDAASSEPVESDPDEEPELDPDPDDGDGAAAGGFFLHLRSVPAV